MIISPDIKFLQNYLSTVFNEMLISSIARNKWLYANLRKKYFDIFFFTVKNHSLLNFNCLMDIWALDFPKLNKRFQLNYLLMSTIWNLQFITRFYLDEKESQNSLTPLYASAAWLERELWDMFGTNINGNPDLRRILTDYGFEGHPLRKDFPLSGYEEIRFDYEEKRIVYEPIEFIQEFRFFFFQKAWKYKI